MSARKYKKVLITLVKTLLFALLIAIILAPLAVMLSSSLKTYNEVTLWPPQLFWFTPHWENYSEILWGEKSIIQPLINSTIVASCSSVICLSFGVLAAYAVTRFKFKGRGVFLFIILATQLFSSVLLVNPMYIIFRDLGLLNSLLGLIIAHSSVCLPMTVWLLYSYLSSIPLSLEEASFLDGCTRLQSIRYVTIPLILPGIITAGLFSFIVSWGDLIFARTFIFEEKLRLISVSLTLFQSYYTTNWELQMAAGVLSSLLILILFLLIQKRLVQNMAGSGIKA